MHDNETTVHKKAAKSRARLKGTEKTARSHNLAELTTSFCPGFFSTLSCCLCLATNAVPTSTIQHHLLRNALRQRSELLPAEAHQKQGAHDTKQKKTARQQTHMRGDRTNGQRRLSSRNTTTSPLGYMPGEYTPGRTTVAVVLHHRAR